MIKTLKVAISLPKDDFDRIEQARKKLKLQRSTAIDQAIQFWLNHLDNEEKIRKYEAGYLRQPESLGEVKAMEAGAAEAFEEGSW